MVRFGKRAPYRKMGFPQIRAEQDTLLSLGKGRENALVLPQEGDGTGLIDFPGEDLTSLSSGCWWGGSKGRRRRGGRRGTWDWYIENK